MTQHEQSFYFSQFPGNAVLFEFKMQVKQEERTIETRLLEISHLLARETIFSPDVSKTKLKLLLI